MKTAPDRDAQGLAVAVEQHDRPDPRAHGAHGALQDVGEQVLDARDAGGHLDHVVEGAQLEHEVLEALGRGPQLDEHAPERLGDLTDLVHLAEPGHVARRAFGRGRRRALGGGLGRDHGLAQGASEVGNARGQPSEEDVAEQRDGERKEDAELNFRRLQEPEPPHEVEEDQERQNSGQRKDRAGRFAEFHRVVTGVFTRVLLV